MSDSNGVFSILNVQPGRYELVVSVLGYLNHADSIGVTTDEHLDPIVLKTDVLGLNEVVVSGTLKETYLRKSPVKIEVISGEHLLKSMAPTNLMEGIFLVNGLQEVTACGVCYTNGISVNGLPGAYTAILVDGTPMFGNLASVYGLNGIPTQVIDRIEIIRGPSSTLYGSEAVAGVINVITKDPATQPLLSVDVMGSSHLEGFGNFALSTHKKGVSGFTGLNLAHVNNFVDQNDDGFGDIINFDRYALFSKWVFDLKNDKHFSIAGKLYYEDRRNGVEDYLDAYAYRSIRGNDSIYGESIYTKRAELFGTYELPFDGVRLDYSFSRHLQDSYYGSDQYVAEQNIGYANLIWNKTFKNHDVVSGLTGRYQRYDDNTIATETLDGNSPDDQVIAGAFIQDEWTIGNKLTLLPGIRVDHYARHGVIPAPRFNLKYAFTKFTTARLNFGTGFRIVNLFTEDHAFISGQREVEILETLLPERSTNISANLNHVYALGNGTGMIDIDGYYTYFNNKIVPDYSDPGKILYANSDGYAVSYGLGINMTHRFSFPVRLNIGLNLQDVYETSTDNGVTIKDPVEFAARWSGVASINFEPKKSTWTFAYTSRITGPMTLPELYDLDANGNPISVARPTVSKPFGTHNVQIQKQFKNQLKLYFGVQNIFNQIQVLSPLVGYNDPNAPIGFSNYFDTSYAFGSTQGREFYIGIRWNVDGKVR